MTSSALSTSERTPAGLRRFAKFTAFSTLFLIFAGAMVTSTGSGLAVPDWPLSYGTINPPMIGGIFYEHGHRVIAATVGLLTVIQALWLQFREPKRFVRKLGWIAVGAVIFQGLLGGLTVLFLLPPAISVAHAGTAELFFCLNVSIAFFTSNWFHTIRDQEKREAPVGMTTTLVALVYMQIILGAVMRHLGAGLAIPDFPLAFGRLIPEFISTGVAFNFAHRVGGFTILFFVCALAYRLVQYRAGHPVRSAGMILTAVVPVQVLLGAYTIWSQKQPHLTSVHVMTGALTLALSLILALTARTVARRRVTDRAGALVASEVAA